VRIYATPSSSSPAAGEEPIEVGVDERAGSAGELALLFWMVGGWGFGEAIGNLRVVFDGRVELTMSRCEV
jgi:hypothetical protein